MAVMKIGKAEAQRKEQMKQQALRYVPLASAEEVFRSLSPDQKEDLAGIEDLADFVFLQSFGGLESEMTSIELSAAMELYPEIVSSWNHELARRVRAAMREGGCDVRSVAFELDAEITSGASTLYLCPEYTDEMRNALALIVDTIQKKAGLNEEGLLSKFHPDIYFKFFAGSPFTGQEIAVLRDLFRCDDGGKAAATFVADTYSLVTERHGIHPTVTEIVEAVHFAIDLTIHPELREKPAEKTTTSLFINGTLIEASFTAIDILSEEDVLDNLSLLRDRGLERIWVCDETAAKVYSNLQPTEEPYGKIHPVLTLKTDQPLTPGTEFLYEDQVFLVLNDGRAVSENGIVGDYGINQIKAALCHWAERVDLFKDQRKPEQMKESGGREQ